MRGVSTPAVHAGVAAGPTAGERRASRLRHRYGLLLGALVASFMVQGVVPGGRWQEVLVTALVSTTLVLAIRAGEVGGRWERAAVAAGVIMTVVVAVLAAAGVPNEGVARVAGTLLVLGAPPAVVLGVLRMLRERGEVTVQAVLGVLCIYLLLGMFYASLYGAIDRIGNPAFFSGGEAGSTANCLYFSFSTMTTVGYGDLTPAGSLGRMLAVGEALVGQIYLVTVVAVLVANLGRRHVGG
jgi:hypothetical protein